MTADYDCHYLNNVEVVAEFVDIGHCFGRYPPVDTVVDYIDQNLQALDIHFCHDVENCFWVF